MSITQLLIARVVPGIIDAEQSLEVAKFRTNRLQKLMTLFFKQVDCLNRYRNRSKDQVIQVQHVNVEDGGQAVVGNIKTGGSDG